MDAGLARATGRRLGRSGAGQGMGVSRVIPRSITAAGAAKAARAAQSKRVAETIASRVPVGGSSEGSAQRPSASVRWASATTSRCRLQAPASRAVRSRAGHHEAACTNAMHCATGPRTADFRCIHHVWRAIVGGDGTTAPSTVPHHVSRSTRPAMCRWWRPRNFGRSDRVGRRIEPRFLRGVASRGRGRGRERGVGGGATDVGAWDGRVAGAAAGGRRSASVEPGGCGTEGTGWYPVNSLRSMRQGGCKDGTRPCASISAEKREKTTSNKNKKPGQPVVAGGFSGAGQVVCTRLRRRAAIWICALAQDEFPGLFTSHGRASRQIGVGATIRRGPNSRSEGGRANSTM